MAEMQEISVSIQSTDPSDEQALLKLGEIFLSVLQPFLKNVGDIYNQGRDLSKKLAILLNDKS